MNVPSRLKTRQIVLQSLKHYGLMNLLLASGVSVATAVILGALLVGDSVRGSMRGQVLDRLGRVEFLLLSPRLVPGDFAERLHQSPSYPESLASPIPTMLFTDGTAESGASEGDVYRSSSILVLAHPPEFWTQSDTPLVIDPTYAEVKNRVVLNQRLADDLHVKVGDEVTLRLPREQSVPADSPLGRRDDLIDSLPRLRVVAIVPNQGMGSFAIRPSQMLPRNAFLDLEFIQSQLRRDSQINSVFLFRRGNMSTRDDLPRAKELATRLLSGMQWGLSDFGLEVERVQSPKADGAEPGEVFEYFHVTSQQLLLADAAVEAIQESLPVAASQPMLTYLANGISLRRSDGEPSNLPASQSPQDGEPSDGSLSIPYSTVAAIDSGPTFDLRGKMPDLAWSQVAGSEGSYRLPSQSVLIQQWLADQLQAKVGDRLQLDYFLPETMDGEEVERSLEVSVAGIVPLTPPSIPYRRNRPAKFESRPTLFNDPDMTPEVPGITDQDSMNDWDLPFSLTRKVRKEDDDYWADYRLTPKLFLPLAEGQSLFGSRFGKVSSIRIAKSVAKEPEAVAAMILPALAKRAEALGLNLIPLAAQQWQAAQGTTPFDMLFLSLSFFVIVSALLLVSLLFRLSLEQRAVQWGLLRGLGWEPRRVARLANREGLMIAMVGGLIGVGLGIAYAEGLLWILSRWWVGAIGVPFLRFHMTPLSLFMGYGLSVLIVWLSMVFSARRFQRLEVLTLLQSRGNALVATSKVRRGWRWLAVACLVLALGLIGVGIPLRGESQAGSFLGSGMLILVSGLVLYRDWLVRRGGDAVRGNGEARSVRVGRLDLQELVRNSMRRNPLRSTLAVSMIAFASFLVLAISLFQAQPSESAVGGFDWVGQTSLPIARDLQNAKYQQDVLGAEASALQGSTIMSLRVKPGDDASCSNLYQASQPRVLGVPREMGDHDRQQEAKSRFPWAKTATLASGESPWSLLEQAGDGSRERPYPVVLDLNTAMWSLHRGAAIGEEYSFRYDGRDVWFRTVGLLQNTLLQGSLMVSESHFKEAFPAISGYQMFLVDVSKVSEQGERSSRVLEKGWGDEGMDVIASSDIVSQLLAVQNTYLSAFQALGALGLLLGTLGLAVVQWRSVYERRQELAILQAVGYTPTLIRGILLRENLYLLGTGIVLGGVAAVTAALPAWLLGQPLGGFVGPIGMLIAVVLVGMLASLVAMRQAMHLPVLASLRAS